MVYSVPRRLDVAKLAAGADSRKPAGSRTFRRLLVLLDVDHDDPHLEREALDDTWTIRPSPRRDREPLMRE
jgi:hypothetical protein